jgi:heme/copper-type cytochrome/quinol oxidase subunit 2
MPAHPAPPRRLIFPLALLLLGLLAAFAPAPASAKPTERVYRVEAEDFAFSPAELYANPGDRVTIELVSKDVAHGLAIDGYSVDLSAEPGQPARATFTAEKAGAFTLRCSVACGNLHPFMTGKFNVGPNLLFYRAAGLALVAALAGLWMANRGR